MRLARGLLIHIQQRRLPGAFLVISRNRKQWYNTLFCFHYKSHINPWVVVIGLVIVMSLYNLTDSLLDPLYIS